VLPLPCCSHATCSWRYIKFDSAGKLLVTIGVPCNVCDLDKLDPKENSGGKGKFRYGETQHKQQQRHQSQYILVFLYWHAKQMQLCLSGLWQAFCRMSPSQN
jgi:glucose/arabinose dehydrogenase